MSGGFENLIRDRKCFYGLKIKTHIYLVYYMVASSACEVTVIPS